MDMLSMYGNEGNFRVQCDKEDEPQNLVRHCTTIRNGFVIVPNRYIGRKGPNNRACFTWPRYSPNLTTRDLYIWGFIKDCVYVPPLPADLPDSRNRIKTADANHSRHIEQRFGNNWAIDVMCTMEFRNKNLLAARVDRCESGSLRYGLDLYTQLLAVNVLLTGLLPLTFCV
ncbi:hypothetical protein J6590_033104 [Homalodisca vitripennis]|nr:hypothetical protein J6590_033104 [Homalodisca vitripennis]